MTTLTKAKTAVLWFFETVAPPSSFKRVVVPAGNRVCLRAYSSYQMPIAAQPYLTRANFRTTADDSAVVFSDLVPQISWTLGMAGTSGSMIEIPGDGVLFEDGLFIELEQVSPVDRSANMKTLLQVVYS